MTLRELRSCLPLMEPACGRINGPAPSHESGSFERDRDMEVPPCRIHLRPQPLGVLELKNNRSSNFPADALRRARRNQRNMRRTGQAL